MKCHRWRRVGTLGRTSFGGSSGWRRPHTEVTPVRSHCLATAQRVESLQDLTSQYSNTEALPLELDNVDNIEGLGGEVAKSIGGRLDFSVNNAGTHYAATAVDLDVDKAAKLFTVNVYAVMRLYQLFVPLLREAPHGRIVRIGSVTRDVPVMWQGAYNASKAALSQYTKILRLELKPFGISVIEVVTGFVRSNILHHGLYAPDNSFYLPVKSTMERIRYKGNANGMMTDVYARSVIWEGNLTWYWRFIVACCPLSFYWILFRYFGLNRVVKSRHVSN
ncbi:hypothetical protein EDB81DRAFT_911684 [Dactylonectria macrodidyma]|uniref:Uncharacterized protein n=1 Tax=Dactylonectria macrodidyma TaxID=307937 RepID=A0A9P9DSM7_9HYPO|nr:hypothetical protein EDB81DRAFT_911684 [Dactylonectria macrodidyma]